MRRKRILEVSVLLLLSGSIAMGATACGSSNGNESGDTNASEITPEKKAPDSAGDKSKDAPDAGISDRPGGPGSSKPAAP